MPFKDLEKRRQYHREYMRKYIEENREKLNNERRKDYEENKEKERRIAREYYQKHRVEMLPKMKIYRNKPEIKARRQEIEKIRRGDTKFSVLAIYSEGQPICQCCKEIAIEFLTIDHIRGGGRKHTREKGVGGGYSLYRWLIKNNYPEGFRVLCMNCNFAYGKYGYCPHNLYTGLNEKRTWNKNAKPEEEGFEPMVLKGKDAKRFINEMKKPLTEKQKKMLKRGEEVYASIKRKPEDEEP